MSTKPDQLVVSLHIAYNCPQRIGITIVNATTMRIVSNSYVKPPAFQNYLEYALRRALRTAVQLGHPFSLDHVAIWLADISQESVARAYDRVMQQLFDQGFNAADDGHHESVLWHPKQIEGYRAYNARLALALP